MYRIVFATGNAGKMKEIREILADLGAEVLSMREAGIEADIVEDGNSFEENALIKAKAVAMPINLRQEQNTMRFLIPWNLKTELTSWRS